MDAAKKSCIALFCICFFSAPVLAEKAPGLNATTRIVFAQGGKKYTNIYTIKPDGTDRRQLTDTRAQDWEPAWSPDGSDIRRITSGSVDSKHPNWSGFLR